MLAAINGIWSYKGISVLYDLTFLLFLKIIRADGRGEKKGANRMEKKHRNNNGEQKRGRPKKRRKGKGKTPPPPPKKKKKKRGKEKKSTKITENRERIYVY